MCYHAWLQDEACIRIWGKLVNFESLTVITKMVRTTCYSLSFYNTGCALQMPGNTLL